MWNKQQDCRAEKELRYSIRKYKFGAASVAIAALMFLGAHVASADTVNGKSQSTAGVVNPENKVDSPVGVTKSTENKADVVNKLIENQALTNTINSAPTVDKSKLRKVVEELNSLLSTKLNLDESVVSPVRDRLQKGKEALENSELAQKDIDELVKLLSKDVTVVSAAKESTEVQVDKTEKPADNLANQSSPEVSASEESQTVSAKKDSLKVSVDQLQAAVLELPEHETSKEVLEKANELLVLAQGVIQNTKISPNDIEDLTKRVKRMFNSVKISTLRLTSGSNDPRNGQSMRQGASFRANGQISSGALANIKYFASVDPRTNNGSNTRNNDPEFTKNKTDIKAYYMEDSEGKWIVYDVFFNNDGRKMTGSSYQQHYYFQAPFNIMDPSNTVKELTFTRYRNTGGRRLSDGFQGFEQYGNTATITNPWSQQYRIFNADRDTFYDPNSGVTRDNQRWDVFKNNQYDSTLNQLPKDKNGNYPRASYHLGLDVRRESTDYAVHMHAKIKLKNNITEQEANAYGRAYAATVTKASGTNQSYIMGTLGTSLTPRDTTPPTITANNATVTSREQITPISVTAEDNRGGVGMRDNNPIEVSGLPSGLTYANNRITGTPTGAPGNSTVTIKAYDKNGNMDTKTITITVRSQADAHNPTGAGLTVNQNHTITDAELKAKVSNAGPGTLSIVSRPSTANAGNAGNAVVKVTYPDGTFDNVNVPVTVTDVTGPTITAESATVTKNESITPIPVTAVDNTGGVGMRDNNPIEVTNLPAGLRYANNQITGTPTAGVGYYTVTIKAYDKNNRSTTKQIRITVQDQASKYNPTGETLTVPYNHNITDDEVKAKVQNFAPGNLTVQSKPSTNTSGNVGNAVVKVTYPDGSHDTVNVPVVVGRPNKDDYTPKYNDGSGKPGSSVEIPVSEANGKKIPTGTTYTSGTPGIITVDKTTGKVTVTIPSDKNPGDKVTGKVLVRYPDGSTEEVPVTVTVTPPEKLTPTVDVEQDPKTGDVTVTPKKPDGSTYPPGTKVEIPGKDGNPITVTIGEDGKGKVPNSELPDGKVPGTGKITEPGKPAVEVPVETPAKVTPTTPTPNADQVDTKTTNDNGAKSNDSQNVLPNTGTESNVALASLGLLGMLGGLGLALGKKKED